MMPEQEHEMKEPMPASEFQISPGPHLWAGLSTSKIMYIVVATLALPAAASVYWFGLRPLLVMATGLIFAVATEWVAKKLRNRPFVMDGSAVVTGILLALVLPPDINLWMVALGAIFAIGVVKEAFGGLGQNIFNPALAARAFMASSFALQMTTWRLPRLADAVTAATPLAEEFIFPPRLALYRDLLWGNHAGSLGETSAVAILIGGLILIALKISDWRIPLSYLGSVAILSLVLGRDPIFDLMAGGLMLGAFFMATDYVTAPVTHRGRLIFGAGCGIVTMVIRIFGYLPEGVVYSILFMNSLTPLIDRYIKIRPLGLRKAVKSAA